MSQPMLCERCGDPLQTSHSTRAYSATGTALEVGHDGGSCVFPLGGFVACSWNCLAVLAAQRAGLTADAAVRIVAERERQVTAEGYSPEHDASMPLGELAQAGICYAQEHVADQIKRTPDAWPWDSEWWKPKSKDRDLIRAGALIAAEADRDPAQRAQRAEPF